MEIVKKGWNADELETRYYEWLTGLIPGWTVQYSVLLRALYETPFRVSLLMDENRVGDGLSLRARFVYLNQSIFQMGANEREVLKQLRPCSVLEVMLGLALRFNEDYMTQYTDEDPIGTWFGPMIASLGLEGYDDRHFNLYGYDAIIKAFLDREYAPDGRGGLFYIPGIDIDMRQVEIWRQMMMWNNKQRRF